MIKILRPKLTTGLSVLAQTFHAAIALRARALANGDALEDADAIVVGALKAAWPKARDTPWVYLCNTCSDTGWELHDCAGVVCGRAHPHAEHTYVTRCFCTRGQRLQSEKPRTAPEQLGKGHKAPQPQRLGCW